MRCLYCGKELALLKRLTGGGEFCSDAHKQSYQEEYNRLGLSRLLQARSRSDESKVAQKPPAGPVAPVAVVERSVEAIRPELEEAVGEVEEVRAKKAGRPPVAPTVVAAPPEPAPPPMVGFAMEAPSIAGTPQPESYLEPWMSDEATEPPAPPPAPAWHLEVPSVEHPLFTLSFADLVSLEMQPGACEGSHAVMDTSAAPRETSPPRVHLSLPLTVTSSHEFHAGGSIAIEILPRPSESSCYASLNGAVDFAYSGGVQVLDLLLDLSPAGIAYPAEECEVTVPGSWTNGIISEGPVDIVVPAIPLDAPVPELPEEPAPVPPPAATPRAALEALSRLHQDMREREEAKPAAGSEAAIPAPAPALEPARQSEASSAKPSPAKPSPAKPSSAKPPSEPTPREAELLAIPVKSFAPAKVSPVIDAGPLVTNAHPLLPRLKALPLRAKVAPAPRGFGQQAKNQTDTPPPAAKVPQNTSSGPTEARPVTTNAAPAAARPKTPDKPAPTAAISKPSQPQTPPAKKAAQTAEAPKPKQTAPPAQSVQSVPSPAQSKAEPSAKPVPVKSAPTAPKAQPPKSSQPAPPAQPAQPQKPEPAVAKASSPVKSEPDQKAPAAKEETAGKAKAAAAAYGSAAIDHTVPNFGAVVNTSMFGSLKVKIGLAVLIAVAGIGVYFQVASKGKTSAVPTKAGDGVGMSIMVGEGGWVENWAGDPIGLHGGRQITIYRPSLKLADYRMEFQGQIDTKGIGWIFRAADPDNYYAMKLQLVSLELPLTVALYKYIVLKGRQVQVGRVPIDVPVKNDTVYSIRVDVRGPKFNTYVQGQPVDVWTDDQLRSGGVGFLNERGERGKIKSVALSYLSGGTK